MTTQEHYFENLLYHGKDADGEYNKNALSKEVQETIEICANYVIYTIFNNRDDLKKYNIIKTNNPHDDSWEDYANRLCDLSYSLGASEVLKGIKEEIQKEENIWYHDCESDFSKDFDVIRVDTVLSIIDKYRESEGV